MKISIFGCGWLGFPLARSLAAAGYTVNGSTATEEKLPALREAGIRPFRLTVSDGLDGGGQRDFFASDTLVITLPFRRHLSRPEMYRDQMRCLMAQAASAGVARIIWTGSTAVYPDHLARASEDAVFIPDHDRARVLWDVEQDLLTSPRFAAVSLRLAGLCGGGRRIGRFLAGKVLPTDGAEPVNLVHQEDAVALTAAVTLSACGGEVFNICADAHPARRDLYIQAARRLGLPPPQFTPGQPGPVKVVTNDKIKDRMGYRFVHPDPMCFPD